jgi:hypothetical protein
MKNFLISIFIALLLFTNALACDFKGVSVGDKIDIADVMKKLGVTQYKVNPKQLDFTENHQVIEEYGLIGAQEVFDWKIGSYCNDKACVIPSTVIGDNIPASVYIIFDKNTKIIKAIDISVSESYWNELVSIVKNKYKGNWKKESSSIHISNYRTNKGMTFDRDVFISKASVKSGKKADSCELTANQFDIIFEHPPNLGKYHSVFSIELISNNF